MMGFMAGGILIRHLITPSPRLAGAIVFDI
jgi:hypothetical protein